MNASTQSRHASPIPLPTAMRAVVQPAYGTADVLRVEEVPRPTPGAREVLVEVRAAGVNKGDAHLLTGRPYLMRLMGFGLLRPAQPICGVALAGRVAAVGSEVTAWHPGDRVYAEVPRGAWAGFAVVAEDLLAPMPAGLSFEQAAAVPVAAVTALHGLRTVGDLQAGQRVLINGASGGVGTYAVQLAKALGAHVTAVCSTRNADQARALGADVVVDYTQDDPTVGSEPFDLVLDMVGNHPLAAWRRVLKQEGTYVAGAKKDMGDWLGPIVWMLGNAWADRQGPQHIRSLMYTPAGADLRALEGFLSSGAVVPAVERTWPMAEAAAALRYVGEGHARGKVVLVA